MQIQLNKKPLCIIKEDQVEAVYSLLDSHAFTFHLDKEKHTLNIMSPLCGQQIILESSFSKITDRLLCSVQSNLINIGFSVSIIESKQQRKQLYYELDHTKSAVWLMIIPNKKSEVKTQYFLRGMKQSKKLAHLLMTNIKKYGEVPTQKVSFNWKSSFHSQRISMPAPWITAAITYGSFLQLSSNQLVHLGHGITRAVVTYFSPLPILDMIDELYRMEKKEAEVEQTVLTAIHTEVVDTSTVDECREDMQVHSLSEHEKEQADVGDEDEAKEDELLADQRAQTTTCSLDVLLDEESIKG